jgi:pimeloyl-ACP methyl ester carboxylesterase
MPVLYFHGGMSSRLDIGFGDSEAKAHRVRLLAPDRPGIGGSDRAPRHTIASWAADVSALAERTSSNDSEERGYDRACGGDRRKRSDWPDVGR